MKKSALYMCGVIALAGLSQAAAATVRLNPGENIQAAVDRNPEGTVFQLSPGVYRQQTIRPKNNNQFIGDPGAVISGAKVLSFTASGTRWVATGQTQRLTQANTGYCDARNPLCKLQEDLFIDNTVLKRVGSLAEVAAGKWFFDYAGSAIYIADNPAGKTIEVSVLPEGFLGGARDVTLRGLTIEKFASRAQGAAVSAPSDSQSTGWIIENNEIRFNHGKGLSLHSGMVVRNNKIHTNGQLGAGGEGSNILFEGNELHSNNYALYDPGWEGGATKFAVTDRLLVRGNYVHHNFGYGLWTDIDNIDTTYEDNIVEYNEWLGIDHEISYRAVIRNNTVRYNGLARSVWLWGAQITLQNSRDVEIYGNTITVAAAGGNGIALINQDRGSGKYGPCVIENNYIHNNEITYEGEPGMSGQVADHDENGLLARNNRFNFNTYRFPSDGGRWYWGEEVDWDGLRALGQETGGRIVLASETTDTTPPTVAVTSPAAGSTISGIINITANAADNRGVAGVTILVDNVQRGSEDVAAPFSVSIDTRTLPNGTHTLSAVARDAAGNKAASPTISIVVNNATADTIAPTVSITAPAAGSTVSGTITLSASASDNIAVSGVQFKIDGVNTGVEDTAAPYSISLDTSALTSGTHTVSAEARDAAGNRTSAVLVSFTITSAQKLACPAAAANAFTACYYDDIAFTSLKQVRTEQTINYQFGFNAPFSGMGRDTYSISWNGQFSLQAGTYTFTVTADDGVRLYVDGAPVINKWINQNPTTYRANVTVLPGTHNVRMEYYNGTGSGTAKLSWTKIR